MKYSLAIFDLDGTILNTLSDLTSAVNVALSRADLPLRTENEVCGFFGNGILKALERAAFPCTDQAVLSSLYSDFTEYYSEHCTDATVIYSGIEALFSFLRSSNVKIAVASNKDDYAVKKLCSRYFGDSVDLAVGRKNGIAKKPAPDMVNGVLDRLRISREKAVLIGDSDVDIETAANAGLPCISVTWGFKDRKFLEEHGAELIVDNTCELENILM